MKVRFMFPISLGDFKQQDAAVVSDVEHYDTVSMFVQDHKVTIDAVMVRIAGHLIDVSCHLPDDLVERLHIYAIHHYHDRLSPPRSIRQGASA